MNLQFTLRRDLTKIILWAWERKMKFNADKTEEVVFSCKRENRYILFLNVGMKSYPQIWNINALQ